MDRGDLWAAVLHRALVDASYIGRNAEALLDKQQAHSWITGGGDDFYIVCVYAGVDPEYLRDAYLAGKMLYRTPRGRQARTLAEDFRLTEAAA